MSKVPAMKIEKTRQVGITLPQLYLLHSLCIQAEREVLYPLLRPWWLR